MDEGPGVESRLDGLISLWQEARAAGRDLPAADLCRDCPELLPDLQRLLRDLRHLSALAAEHMEEGDASTAGQAPGSELRAAAETPGAGGPGCVTPTGPANSPEPEGCRPPHPVPGYEVLSELGRGGMGVVYRARRLATGEVVALKTLQRMTPAGLFRFKQEFRVVSGMAHPNLITLHEMVSDGAGWFFAMEVLEGVSLRDHVLGSSTAPRSPSGNPAFPPEAAGRLRGALTQLAGGLSALHGAGVLHRDVKPSNVLVTHAGRVVLLDFGLSAELTAQGLYHSSPGQVVGTVAYMAPEQAAGAPLPPAADWYSVGVVLYELLAGRLPFGGSVHGVLVAKQESDPPPPSRACAGVPPDLESLCMGLLHRDPARRLGGADIKRCLTATADPAGTSPAERQAMRPRLIGRDEHLRALEAAFVAVRRGAAVCARVQGPSGAGKSTLARCLLDRLADGGAVALAGRCFEQELVPFKAFDGVVDSLSRYLAALPDAEATAVVPRDVGALVRLFPVLGQVPAVAAAPSGRSWAPDPREARRRGLGALRELLARLADRHPLVLLIDDLQWSDADSAVLLDELLRPPDPPALMLLLCYRSEDADTPPLRAAGRIAAAPPTLEVVDVAVGPLSEDNAQELAEWMLQGAAGLPEGQAWVIAHEAAGNPFYVGELAEAARSGLAVDGNVSLDEVLRVRISRLPTDARRSLEAVAVAGRPVRPDIIRRAVGLGAEFHGAQALLRTSRLVRTTGPTGENLVTPYHDRVREAVLAHLTPDDRRGHHLGLARAAETDGDQDPEFLAVHYHGAGESQTAAKYYRAAGTTAAAATAFDHAARLYRLAADLGTWSPGEGAELRASEADALANAGRGAAAGEAYLAAAARVGGEYTIDWRRRAAEQFLISGHVDEGLRVLRDVLASAGMRLPATPHRALFPLLLDRMRLWFRGFGFVHRPASSLPVAGLHRIDVCLSAASGLSIVDIIRGAHFQTRGLLLALRAGEPGRIAMAMAWEGAHSAGSDGGVRSSRLIDAAGAIAASLSDPRPQAVVKLARGVQEHLLGRYNAARQSLGEAEQTLRDRCTGVTWELDTARACLLWALCYLGELTEVSGRLPALMRDARDRGDLFAEANYAAEAFAYVQLANDQPSAVSAQLEDIIARWTQHGFHLQHHSFLMTSILLRLYEGDGVGAWEYVVGKEPLYRRAMLWRMQQLRIDFLQLRARSAIAAAGHSAAPKQLLAVAERDARKLQRESAPWGQALGALMLACVRDVRTGAGAAALFGTAAGRLEAAGLGVYAAAARYREGERTSGDEGLRLREKAVAWLVAHGVKNPLRMIHAHAPEVRR